MTTGIQTSFLQPEWTKPVIQLVNSTEDVQILSQKAVLAIYDLFVHHKVVSVAFSGGKDSSVVMHLTIQAAIRAQQDGLNPRVLVTSSDTGVENPEVAGLMRAEHAKIRATLKKHGIAHDVIVAKPSLATSWAVRYLGGNKLPSYPGGNGECAVFLKVAPMERLRNQMFKVNGSESVVTLVGTRFEESEKRRAAMERRGELAHKPYVNANGEMVMSPIAFWSVDDVWELIGLVKAGKLDSYSDFEDMFTLYANAGGTSCAVVSDAITEGAKKARGGCGARFGCFTCQVVSQDNSLRNMIDAEPRFDYMRGLNQYRDLIAKVRWDYSKRYWVMRSIGQDGTIKLTPDCFSPAFLLELFKYAATLDVKELTNARKAKIKPRFQILSVQAVVAIDAMWSLNGFHKPHTALLTWLEITSGRASYDMPNVDAMPSAERLRINHEHFIHVGSTWDGDGYSATSGMRDAVRSLADCWETKTLNDDRALPVLETEESMQVDIESYAMAVDFEMEDILERHNAPSTDWTDGYRFWVAYGTLQLSPMQVHEHDLILRRTAWRARNGFIGEQGNERAQMLGKQFDMLTA